VVLLSRYSTVRASATPDIQHNVPITTPLQPFPHDGISQRRNCYPSPKAEDLLLCAATVPASTLPELADSGPPVTLI